MKKFSDFKIKTKLMTICLLLVVLPVAALGLFSYKAASDSIFGLIQEKLELQVKVYMEELSYNLDQVQTELHKARESARMTVGQLSAVVSDLVLTWNAESTDKLKEEISQIKVGKTGYIFILDYEGRYILSKNHEKDGINIFNSKDESGRLFIQDILSKAKTLPGDGTIGYEEYFWKNQGESVAREKIVGIIHVPKYKWVVCVSAYFDDLVDMGIKEEVMNNFKTKLKAQKIGESGYMFVIDSEGVLVMHPSLEGKNIYKYDFIKTLTKEKRGYTQYPWEGREKVVAYTYYEPNDWIISAGSYLSDFTGPLTTIRNLIVIVSLVALILGILVAISFANSITNPIVRSAKMMNEMAAGDFSKLMQAEDLARKDEIGIIARAIKGTNENVGKMIAQVKDAADQLASATEEISSSSQQISDGAQQQSASFEELTSSVQTNAESSDNANSLSQNVSINAKKAEEAMANTVEAMSCVEKSSGRIAEAVTLITDIADQTNLLALNAAIEAARAGEHGKGFAVVADEVRQLAERSAASAKDIENLIKEASRQVDDGVKVSKEAGDRLNEIVSDIGTVAEQIQSISDSTKEQAAAMEENSSITTSNASSSEELAASAEELASQAESLQQIVSMFKINAEVIEKLHNEARESRQA